METKKILIVDDDIDVINILKPKLKFVKYNVLSAMNKEEGLAIAKTEKPDLIILDVMMTTYFEGFELRSELLKDQALRNIPVVFETAMEIFTTTKSSVQELASEYRLNPQFKELQVLFLKDESNNEAGIDYLDEQGKNHFVPADGFIKKPADADKVLAEIKRLIG